MWGIPPDGLTETITEPLVDLHGHGRKVTLLRFHPTANNVFGSVSGDFSVKVWDIPGDEAAAWSVPKTLTSTKTVVNSVAVAFSPDSKAGHRCL